MQRATYRSEGDQRQCCEFEFSANQPISRAQPGFNVAETEEERQKAKHPRDPSNDNCSVQDLRAFALGIGDLFADVKDARKHNNRLVSAGGTA